MSDRRPPTFPRKRASRNFLPEHRRALLCRERYTPLGRLTRRREKPAAVPDFVPRCEKCRPLYQISYRASRNAALCTHMKKFTGTAGSFSRQENRPRGTPGWIARHLSPRNGTLDDFSRHPFLSAGTEGDISCSSRDPTGTEGNISRHGFRRGGTEDGISRRGPRRAVQRTAFLGAGTGGRSRRVLWCKSPGTSARRCPPGTARRHLEPTSSRPPGQARRRSPPRPAGRRP